ncbi:S-methyl-5-thioribose kinase [Xenorhabdus mauleonii]|uniref:S-methyl-5-thioribose kinase n=1 Tax=Xenorhabdus mauleonii TaxID=351675 RepID=A0A1I3JE28_9GAMM|nr:S-methyl-5-thioribose kinase [Xenorhabdus mauleonii]PHM46180.1 S-methyl-5-thioribose kinase [Xenorhabdus mauleonii]SFI58406.1 5'-methylthioribose kinase [Xenorhabdus mauleonii]
MSAHVPTDYTPQNCESLPNYLAKKLPETISLGGLPESWQVQEVGDGNLNLVFIVSGKEKTIVVKQALPYVRAAGESWPLSLSRSYFEYNALLEENKIAGVYVPDVYFYDEDISLFAMEYLSDHIILRKQLIAGKKIPYLAENIGVFLAKTLFHTSDIGISGKEKKELLALFTNNHELCKITEDLIFTEPYFKAERNNWTSPQLDDEIYAIWQDRALIQTAMQYKYQFMTNAQSLLHGDLHSGSIMVASSSVKVIDPEFSFMGPMAFDIGNYIGNLLMAYFAQPALRENSAQCSDYQAWLLEQIETTWSVFEHKFRQLWNEKESGDAYPIKLYQQGEFDSSFLKAAQDEFLSTLFKDTLAYAGFEINRRIIGFAGVADFQQIEDQNQRAACQKSALKLARELIVNRENYPNFSLIKRYIAQC